MTVILPRTRLERFLPTCVGPLPIPLPLSVCTESSIRIQPYRRNGPVSGVGNSRNMGRKTRDPAIRLPSMRTMEAPLFRRGIDMWRAGAAALKEPLRFPWSQAASAGIGSDRQRLFTLATMAFAIRRNEGSRPCLRSSGRPRHRRCNRLQDRRRFLASGGDHGFAPSGSPTMTPRPSVAR